MAGSVTPPTPAALTWIKPATDGPAYAAPMTSTAWLGDHRGALTVTDDFAVLDDPLEQDAFTERDTAPDGAALCRSVLVVQGPATE